MNTMKCNFCETGDMEHVQVKRTALYVCDQCPNIQMEYYNLEDVINMKKYLEGELNPLSLVEVYHYIIADYLGLVTFDGDTRQLGREVHLVLSEGSDLVSNIYESHSNIDYDLLENIITELDITGDNVIYTEIRK